ncbi:hypothetical protein ACLB2K_043599 [Fragaria x ananassa]
MRRRRPLLYPKPHTAAATAASKLGDILLVASITKTYPSANLFCSYKIVGSLVVITLVSKLGVVRLEILASPCNQFGAQEPGSNDEIVEFACTRFKADRVSRPSLTSRYDEGDFVFHMLNGIMSARSSGV